MLYDGPVVDPEALWTIVADERVTVFGTSPPYLRMCEAAGYSPKHELDMSSLRSVLSTGAIIYDDQFDWVKENVGALPVQSISGGTDIVGCFVLGNPNLPVYAGEAQCRSFGLDVRAVIDDSMPSDAHGWGVGVREALPLSSARSLRRSVGRDDFTRPISRKTPMCGRTAT